ncbi:hypothetical protein RDV64_22890 (plasmid) [Acuticoccus sp. MNP-M23]|uniref:hypothetical protein n=1 Tax=Acuticoccus sp. MNP-M23 TaxID=3072793 RepID=UPI002814A643|nr:hypothetical protein [Acuticoccus sp. MNP-M23]WMS45173.1 hypothetical protein RDV64_22890 [Acuticoccus sp. MNP-M23]
MRLIDIETVWLALMKISHTDAIRDEDLFEKLAVGHKVEVVCTESARKKNSIWYGCWHLRFVCERHKIEYVLVKPRCPDEPDRIEPRYFKTALSLLCYLAEMGIAAVTIPMRVGRNSVQRDG